MKNLIRVIFLTTFLFSMTEEAKAATYHVLETEFIGDFKSEAKAFRKLIEHSLGSMRGVRVVRQKEAAETILQPKIIETGDAYILFLDSLDRGGNVVTTKSIKIVSGDELDIAAERLAAAMVENESVDETVKVGSITHNEETAEHRRKRARTNVFVGFGPAVSTGLGSRSQMTGFNLGIARQAGQNLLKAEIQTHSGNNDDNSNFSGVGLGIAHILSKKDFSPIFHAGLLYVGATPKHNEPAIEEISFEENREEPGKAGFALRFGAGLFMFQTSTVHLETSFMVNIFLDRIETGVPAVYGLNMNLYFGGS